MKTREIQPEGRAQTHAVERFVDIGTDLFKNSNLIRSEGTIGQADVVIARQFIQTIAPVTIENYRTHAHLQLTANVARTLGKKLQEKNPSQYADLNLDELEILGLFHDMGRLITHRFNRNELLERLILIQIGIREDIIKQNPNASFFTKKDPNNTDQIDEAVKSLSPSARILILADLLGKRTEAGGILTFEQVMQYHEESRRNYETTIGLEATWPSEQKLTPEFIDFTEKVYRRLYEWVQAEGLSPEMLQQEILVREKDAHVKAVIFDIGNVLIPNPDPVIIQNVMRTFSITEPQFEKCWNPLVRRFQVGELSSKEFWELFSNSVKRDLPVDSESLLVDPLSTEMDVQLREFIVQLKEQDFMLATLSDTIVPHANKLRQAGFFDIFDFVISSFDIKVTKENELAFKIVALRLWLPPQACLFIDDKPAYIESAKRCGMKAIRYTDSGSLIEGASSYFG